MNKLIESVKSASIVKSLKNGAARFIRDEEGAQIVEYALIIAVVSIAMIVLLKGVVSSTEMTAWITKVKACLSNGAGCT